MQVRPAVSGFSKEGCCQFIVDYLHRSVQKVDALSGVLTIKFYGGVGFIYLFKEFQQFSFASSPYKENIVNETNIDGDIAPDLRQDVEIFEPPHKKTGTGGGAHLVPMLQPLIWM